MDAARAEYLRQRVLLLESTGEFMTASQFQIALEIDQLRLVAIAIREEQIRLANALEEMALRSRP